MPLVPKIDPNKIFASNAPTQDKPAAFDNYEKGMDETRKNNGRPTIKQANYLHQTTDQKILWIHQNGGGLPYDASIEYAENAVTLKDGELKQLVDGTWVEVKTKATSITTASSQNQQQINDFGGAKWYAKSGGYELGATVKLENGDIVKSTVANNINDPNVNMTGWRFDDNTVESIADLVAIQNPKNGMLVYVKSYYAGFSVGGGTFVYNTANADVYDGGVSFGKWRRRYDTLMPQCFGSIGDNTKRFMSTQFATLADAQRHFPHVTDLAVDTLDWAGVQALFNYCKANIVVDVNIQGKYHITKELNYVQGHGALTRKFNGIIELIPNASMHHVIRIAGSYLQFDGIIANNPNQDVYRIPYGIFIGGYLDSDSTINSNFGTLVANSFDVASINVNQNAMFCEFATIRASGGQSGKTTFSNLVHEGAISPIQYTEMNLTIIPYHKNEATHRLAIDDFPDPNSWLYIDNTPYQITSIDREAGTVRIFPQYRGSLTTAEVDWFSGAAFHHGGNNSGCIKVGNISVISSATGISEVALYTGTYTSISTEYCKIGISLGNSIVDPAMCFNVDRSYFELNTVDYIQVGGYSSATQTTIANAVGLQIDKMFLRNVAAIVNPDNSQYAQLETLGSGQYNIGNRTLIPSVAKFQVFEIHGGANTIELGGLRESRQYGLWGATPTFNFTVNDKLVDYFGSSELTLILKDPTDGKKAPTVPVKFNCPEGYVFDTTGTTSITFSGFTKPPVFYVCVYKGWSNTKRILITCDGLKSDLQTNVLSLDSAAKKGTTVQRPASPVLGQRYYDTTLLAAGKPIEWNGVGWVDGNGATV